MPAPSEATRMTVALLVGAADWIQRERRHVESATGEDQPYAQAMEQAVRAQARSLLESAAPAPLPKSIAVQVGVFRAYGLGYRKDDAPELYADMRGGWTPAELRAIADDIEIRCANPERRRL